MPQYQCPRCGYTCYQKNDLRKHFLIKKPCEPKLEDIPQADLLKFHLSGAIQFKSKIQLENMSEEDREKELKRAEEYVKDLKNLMKPKISLDVKPFRLGYRLDPRSRWSWCCACFLVTPMAIRGN